MSFLLHIGYVIFYQPLFNILIFVYNIIPYHDLGLAIVVITIFIKLILYPFSRQTLHAQKRLQDLQPKVQELKVKYKDEKEKLAGEMMKLYKEEKVNPMSSCLPLLVQIPFLIALYHVFQVGLTSHEIAGLYSFVSNPGALDPISFNIINLSQVSIPLALVTAGTQFIQARMLISRKQPKISPAGDDENMTAMMNKQMMIMMPIMTGFIGMTLPSGLILYWLLSTLITIAQQFFTFRHIDKNKDDAVVVIPASN